MLVLIAPRLFNAHINLTGDGGGDGIGCVYQGVLGGDFGGGGGGILLAEVVVREEVGVVVGVEAALGVV